MFGIRTRTGIGLLLLAAAMFAYGDGGSLLHPAVGPCDIVTVRETADDTPEIARMIIGLQSGNIAKEIEAAGHELFMFDDDAKTPDGGKPAMLAAVESAISGLPQPALAIIDRATKRVVHKQGIPKSATAQQVYDIIKGHAK